MPPGAATLLKVPECLITDILLTTPKALNNHWLARNSPSSGTLFNDIDSSFCELLPGQ